MNIDELDRLLTLMLDKGYQRVEVETGGSKIAMTLPSLPTEQPANARISPTKTAPACLRSKAIGTLLEAHPDTDAADEGDAIAQGQPVAYVQTGLCLTAIRADTAGQLGRRLVPAGATVGYNTAVFEFFPDETRDT